MRRVWERRSEAGVDTSTRIGGVVLPNPIMTASGTAGHGAELSGYVDLGGLCAVVVKSLSAEPWPGNPPPRIGETPAGMINSVGLQGPGIEAWAEAELPELAKLGARVVVSIWGHSVEDYARAAAMCAFLPPEVVAVEVNVSCPNLEDGHRMFAHSVSATREVMDATSAAGRPRWAKLSPNVADIVSIAAAAREGGAGAVTLTNTLRGIVIDVERRRPLLGGGGGGVSGPAMHPVAVRAVYDVHAALEGLPIIGVGGVTSAHEAIEFLLAGATAVQVGTANFADPRSTEKVLRGLVTWCASQRVGRISDLVGAAHQRRQT
ncbi:MAG: dihydroorotate dehydrogenase [Acidimicrobiales bacterium]